MDLPVPQYCGTQQNCKLMWLSCQLSEYHCSATRAAHCQHLGSSELRESKEEKHQNIGQWQSFGILLCNSQTTKIRIYDMIWIKNKNIWTMKLYLTYICIHTHMYVNIYIYTHYVRRHIYKITRFHRGHMKSCITCLAVLKTCLSIVSSSALPKSECKRKLLSGKRNFMPYSG